MMELATKTITADNTIGSHKAVRGTMRSLLRVHHEAKQFAAEATPAQPSGQEPSGESWQIGVQSLPLSEIKVNRSLDCAPSTLEKYSMRIFAHQRLPRKSISSRSFTVVDGDIVEITNFICPVHMRQRSVAPLALHGPRRDDIPTRERE